MPRRKGTGNLEEAKKALRAEVWGSDMDRYVLRNPMVEIDGVLVDANAFFATRSGCDTCGSCCTWGTTIPRETADTLSPHLREIGERYIPAERRNRLGWTFSHAWDMEYTNIVPIDGKRKACCFLYKDGERYLCSIYSWAEATGRDPFDYWPFECTMYPIAVLPYKGLLHEGKTLLTLRMEKTWGLVDIYGPARPLSRSLLRRFAFEVRAFARRVLGRAGLAFRDADAASDCYFRDAGYTKPPSYLYYAKHLKWYFGDDFYARLQAAAPSAVNTLSPTQRQ